jgi:Fe-S-cluster containining protein
MSDALAHLVKDLVSDLEYATGDKKFPREVSRDEAADLAEGVQRTVEHWTGVRAEMAKKHQVTIACQRGCNDCCNELIVVAMPEAIAVARWLERPENAAVRAQFLERYRAWREKAGDRPEQIAALTVDNKDREKYFEQHRAYWRLGNLCPFNANGDCTIYAVRPLVCRDAHACETNARCSPSYTGAQPPSRINFTPLESVLQKSHHVLQAAHNAVSARTNRHPPLCVAVYELLTS